MSGNSSISAAIRRRGIVDTSGSNDNNTNVLQNVAGQRDKRLTYVSVLSNHEVRINDIEKVMTDTILTTTEEQSTNIELLLTSMKEMKEEIVALQNKLESSEDAE